MRALLLSLLILLTTLPGLARFQLFTQSNHGELEWKTMESEHFYIHYPTPLEELARETASVAEQIYGPVTQQLQHEPKRRTHLAISDSDQFVNGAAIPDGSIRIFVRQNLSAEMFDMQHEWLRTVIAHEFQHIVAFSAMRDWSGTLGMILFAEIPGWWMEGLAEYYTERWNTLRSERDLRQAALENELSSMEAHDKGLPMVLYLAWRDGDSTLVKICSWRNKFTNNYSFPSAFKKVTGQTPAEFENEWKRVMEARYNADLALREEVSEIGQRFNLPLYRVSWMRLLPDSSAWLATGRRYKSDFELALYRISTDSTKHVSRLAAGPLHRRFALSPDGDRVAFARRHRNRHAAIEYDLHELVLSTDSERRVTHGARAYDPVYGSDGSLYYISEEDGVELRRDGSPESVVYHAVRHEELFSPVISPNGEWVAFSTHDENGLRGLKLLKFQSGQTMLVDPSTEDADRYPLWTNDSTLVYTSTRDGVANLFSYCLSDEDETRITDSGEDMMAICTAAPLSGRFVALAADSADHDRLLLVEEDRVTERVQLNYRSRFEEWRAKMPDIECPAVNPDAPVELSPSYSYRWWRMRMQTWMALPYPGGAFGMVMFSDALALDDVMAAAAYSHEDEDESGAYLILINRMTDWDIVLATSYQSDVAVRVYDGQAMWEISNAIQLGLSRRLDLSAFPHFSGVLTFGAGIWDSKIQSREDLLEDLDPAYPVPVDSRTGLAGAEVRLRYSPFSKADNVWSYGGGTGLSAVATFARPDFYGEADYDWQALDLYHLQPTPVRRLQVFARVRGENLAAREIEVQRALAFSGDPSLGTLYGRPLSPFAPSGRTEFRGLDRLILGDQYGLATGEIRFDLGNLELFEVLGLGLEHTALAWFWDAGVMNTKGGESTSVATCGLEAQCLIGADGLGILAFAAGYAGETWSFADPFEDEENEDRNRWYWRLHLAKPF